MKKIIQISQLHKVLFGLVLISSFASFAQVQEEFTARFNQTVKGDVTMIANNMLSRTATQNYNGGSGNHDFTDNVYVDIDGNTGIGASTFNSSNATFSNPEPALACLSIKKAFLYWAAADREQNDGSDNQPSWDFNDVKLMLPGQTNYTTLTADEIIYRGRDFHFSNDPYICFKDITNSVVNISNPYGTYQVANVEAKTGSLIAHPNGNTGTSGGWQIVFIYESPILPSKNISIFDGYAHVRDGVPGVDKDFDISFNGFQTIPSGPVNSKIVIGSLEGDQDLSGDRLQIRNVVNNFVDISAPQRSSSNFFNSRITVGNSNFTNRTPASLNTLGFDAAVFELDNGGASNNIIGNNQTSATLRLTSNQETYGLYLLGLSVDVWAPDLNPIEMTLNSGMNPTNPGDDLGFSFNVLNSGNDNAVNLEITTTLPPQVEYTGSDNLPSGVTSNYNPSTGELTFLIANGLANIGSPELNIDLNLTVKDECYFLEDSCDLSFDIQFVATYNGVLNPNLQTTLSSATLDSCNVGIQDPSTITVNQPAEAAWVNPDNDLNRTIDCNDTNALSAAQALEPVTDKCNFIYTKTSGSFVEDTNNPNTGTYTNIWTFTDACGRISSEYTQIITVGTPYTPINISFNQNNILCNGESTGSINVNVTGGIPPYTYDWVGPDAFTANTEDLNDLAAGQYTLTVTDSNLCLLSSASIDVTLIEPAVQACEIQVFNCPPVVDFACANSDLGSNVEWMPPTFAYECCTSIDGDDYSFFMEFDLPESAFGANCWDFNFSQRVGSDNLRLFQSTGTGSRYDDSYLITPTQYFNNDNGTPINIELIDVTATVNWTLQVLNPDDNSVIYSDTVSGITSDGQQSIIIPNTVPNGSYKLKFNFDSPNANGGDRIEIDRFYYNATLVDTNCSGGINFVVTSTHNPGDLFVPGETTVTYTATYTPVSGDAISLSCDFEVTVINIDASEDLGSHIDPTCSGGTNGSFTVIPNGGTPPYSFSLDNINFSNTSGVFSNLAAGTFSVYVQDSNGCNDPTPVEITLNVLDTENPSINAPDDYSIEGCNTNAINDLPYSEIVTSITLVQLENALGGNGSSSDDQNIKSITYIDTSSGSCPITIERTYTVTDDCDNSVSDVQIITIEDTTAPQLTLPPNSNIECGESKDPSNTGSATAYDICGSTNITYADTSVTACGNTETITRTWTATDACGNSFSDIQTIIIEDDTPPVLTVPSDITVECNASTDPIDTGNATGSDTCGDVIVTFSDTFDADCGNTGTITRTWTATDECGNYISDVQIITIVDTTPPTLTIPSDITLECDSAFPVENTIATDDCGNVTVTFSDSSVTVCGNSEIISRTWTATDECGNSVSDMQTITIEDNTAPTFTVPNDVTIECDQDPNDLSITGDVTDEADNCSLTSLEATFTDSVAGSNCINESIITRTWTLIDDCDNETTLVQTITVEDKTAPTFTVPANITVECDVDVNDLSLTGDVTDEADNCSTGLEATFADSVASGNCVNESIITRTWTLIDDCDNETTFVQTITVEDNTAPTFTVPANITVECDVDVNDLSLTGDVTDEADNCSTGLEATFADSVASGNCANESIITRTWTLIDDCDNETTFVQTITVEDNTAPVLTIPTDAVVECTDSTDPSATGSATATDTCGNTTVTYTDSSVSACGNTETITRTWTATDDCGNTASESQTISVVDTVAPDLTNCSVENTVLECSDTDNETLADAWNAANIAILEACATDTCDDDLTSQVTSDYDFNNLNTTCGPCGTINVTYTITDDCGNDTSITVTLTFDDGTIPDLSNCSVTDDAIECDGDNNETLANDWNAANISTLETCADDLGVTVTSNYDFANLVSTCGQAGTIAVTYTITDDCGNATTLSATLTIEDTTPPAFTVPNNVTIECDQDPNDLSITGDVTDEADACSSGSLEATFADSVASGNCVNESIITRTWTLIDDCDNETTFVQTITVEDNTAPTFTVPANITVECDVDVNDLSLTGDVTDEADNCSTGLEATFADSVASGNCANESIITRIWTLIDDCDNETTLVQTITVEDNTAPTFTVPANITVECDVDVNDLSLTGDVTDEADNCSTGLEATFADSVASGNCANESIITRTWTLIDDCDNETTFVQTITVEDNTAPTFTVPANITVECDVDVNDLSLTGDVTDEADNCSTGLEATFADSVASGNCANESIITRTWTLIDDCDNETTFVQTITVEDNTAPTFTVPANITVECDVDVNDLSLTGDVTDEADNCSTGLEATFADSVASGNCVNESIITRTWTLIDDCDNETTFVQTITVEDNTAPTFTVPANITVECDVDVNDLSLTGDVTDEADNCSTGLEATFADSVASGNCANESIITRTWTLIDDCDNETTFAQTITVEDNTAPTFTVPANITVECDVDVNDLSLTGDVTDEADNCSTGLEATFADNVSSGNCDNESIITRTWTLIDDCDNETTFAQTITVEDNTAPVLTIPTDAVVECTDSTDPSATGSATATDTCGNTTVTYTDSSVSACGNTETITRTWTATDDCGNTASESQTISVVDTVAPDLTNCSVENTVLECSDTDNETLADAWNAANIATLEACATDTCDDDLTSQVTSDYDFNNLNTTCGPCGTINVTYTITDDCGNDTSITVTLTFDDGTIPDLSNCSVTDDAIECDGDNNETLANDWNAANISTLETCADDLGVTVTSNYDFANLVSTCGQAGTIAVTYTITDDCGNATTLSATLTIEDTTPPTFTVPNDITIECDQDPNDLSITGDVTDEADACSSGSLEATFADSVASGNCANESIITRTWTLIDDCDNETTFVQTITVEDNTAPTFTVPANITVECDVDVNDLSLTGDVTDEADNCSTGLEATFADSVASGNCANESIITRTWTLIDDCDNETTLVQTITVEDNTAPTFTVPANITVECDVDVNDLSLTGDVTDEADNCSTGLEATFADSVASGNCANESIITRTWTLIDDCDNETTFAQTITVEDNTAPTFTVPANITVECDVDVNDLSLTGDVTDEADNCSTGLEATFADSVASGNCANESIITRTWTLIDDCDNETTFVQTITVEDNTAPTFTVPANITVECDVDVNDLSLTGDVTDEADNCSTGLEATFADSVASGNCANESIITRTWTLIDDCDNETTFVQTITVEDNTAPTFTVPANITVECDVDVNDLSLTGDVTDEADNCSTGLEATFADSVASGNCANESIITRTWTLIDDCDNETTFVQTITVEDNTAPTFTVPANITVECDVDVNDLSLTGDVTDEADNCSTGLEATFADSVASGNCANESIITRTWTLIDDCDNETTFAQTITVEDNTAPTFTVPANITVECDVDVNDLSLTGDVTDEADNCSTGLEATFADSVASGNCVNESIITRTWTLIDDCDNETTFVQTITVEDNTAPTFTVPANITVECDVDVNDLSLTGDVTDEADNCSTGLEATFADSVASGNCANESIITRTWTLIDDCDNETTFVQTITVEDNTAPTFTVPANITVECDVDVNDLSLTGDVTDEADNCSTGLEATFADSVASGNCVNESIITRTWTLIDDCDNETTFAQTITVEDNTAPTFTVPANITVECDVDVNNLVLTGDVTDEADNCSTGLEATFTDSVASGNCANESIITRTWKLVDECGNETTFAQTITVEDNTAPTFTVPANITVECDVDVNNLVLTGDVTDEADNCSIGLEATFTDSVASGNCANESIITRTWKLVDECGNETEFNQTITVEDNTAPTFTVPADITVECDVDVNDLSLTGDVTDEADNCSTGLEASYEDVSIAGNCPTLSIITRTWKLTDECGNETEFDQIITVQDTTAPFLSPTSNLEDLFVVCNDIPDVPNLVFEDACSSNMTVTFTENSTSDGTEQDYIIIREWLVEDECGNAELFTQTINVGVQNEIEVLETDGLCILEDFNFDLFDVLSGNFDTDGVWTVTMGDATLDGSFFNPSSLLDVNDEYTEADLGDYTFTYTVGGICPSETQVTININDDCRVLPCGEEDLIISKAVTVNNDGINDFFTVGGIEECGFVIELQIFNRWGAKIYDNSNYQNDWSGQASGASIGNSGFVPTGTYYYIINLKNSGLRPITGPIYVSTN